MAPRIRSAGGDSDDESTQGSAVPLSALAEGVALAAESNHLAENPVVRIRAAHELADIERAGPGDLVVLDASVHEEVSGYRFDLAVARATPGVAAIVGGSPGATGRRVAAGAGIALGSLAPGYDVASLAVLLRDLSRGRQQSEVATLERLVDAADRCAGTDDIERLVDQVARALGRPVRLDRTPGPGDGSGGGRPVRIQGVVRWYLVVEGGAEGPLLDAALSHVVRHIESLLQAEFEARELPEATRSELVNEILLSDVGMWADAAGRLRRAGFPIDGSHCAIRIDSHAPPPADSAAETGPDPGSEAALDTGVSTYRTRQRIADVVLDAVRRTGGTWIRAGTVSSIVLVSSRRTSHGELISREVGDAAALAVEQTRVMLGDLQLHIGVGTPHLGVAGLRTSVNEATTAVRSARDRGSPNEPHHFDRLGFSRALLQWAEIDGVRPIVNQILAPLLDRPPDRAREGLETLRVYLQTGRNVSATAEALHLHRNTVRYRIERIGAELPVDLDDPDERLLLELGCRLIAVERFS